MRGKELEVEALLILIEENSCRSEHQTSTSVSNRGKVYSEVNHC